MTAVRTAMVVLALCAATRAAAAQPAAAQGESRSGSGSRQGADRSAAPRDTDTSIRQTQTQRQTEAPKPTLQRQPEPQRQFGPQRQAEPQRQNTSGRWDDPGPAWRNVGPAWRNLDSRSASPRPGADAFRAKPNTYAPRINSPRNDERRDDDRRHDERRDDHRRRGGHKGGDHHAPLYGLPYFVPYGYSTYYPYSIDSAPLASPVAPAPTSYDEPYGFLRLRVQPRTADVYIDGSLAGTVDDFGGSGERMLRSGPHRVEILAPGFAPLTFDVRVPENDTVTFTRELDAASTEPPPPAAAPVEIPHKALYIVPRCYIGDRPPLVTDMPAGCSVDDVRVIP